MPGELELEWVSVAANEDESGIETKSGRQRGTHEKEGVRNRAPAQRLWEHLRLAFGLSPYLRGSNSRFSENSILHAVKYIPTMSNTRPGSGSATKNLVAWNPGTRPHSAVADHISPRPCWPLTLLLITSFFQGSWFPDMFYFCWDGVTSQDLLLDAATDGE